MRAFRRIVTGHDRDGRSAIVEDGDCPHVEITADATVVNLWLHEGRPDNADGYHDPVGPGVPLAPPARGSVLRVVEFPPRRPGTAPYVHRTESLDYAYVIDGEVHSVFDSGETLLRAGDVLIQRGTNHAWDNRSEVACVVLFALLDAEPLDPAEDGMGTGPAATSP
ncbi:cupin domain-containing protein [Amycolatopsis endophytica]|uniref:Quercetin dioxygenase-like cupin family protein n=1 Tax=Amycolatopsis endophytica TaxID=860233 RepID=A0A853BC47_9PSEU|nr:cupin domain-containing protein [Amycolatopsis endophytica]NYI92355.1 quercetin dioxygenase-like cupin family protein [Amycolatopsis endophytica]